MFFFSENNNCLTFSPVSIETAYLLVLNNDLQKALDMFMLLDSPRARWGRSLVQILKGYLQDSPSYFEIRNFFEIDLDFFIKNDKVEFIESLLGSTDYLISINHEIYKYAARVLLENNIPDGAKIYLDKSKNVFYKDPELHFLYTKYFIITKDIANAKFHINECLRILPDYFPAKKIKNTISENFV